MDFSSSACRLASPDGFLKVRLSLLFSVSVDDWIIRASKIDVKQPGETTNGNFELVHLVSGVSPFAHMIGQCYKQLNIPIVKFLGIPLKNMKSQHKIRHFGLTNFQIAMLILLALADIGLVVVVIRLLGIDFKEVVTYYFFTCLIMTIINYYHMTRFNGSMKRGIPIWRENLPKNIEELLRYMWHDIDNDDGFIRVDGDLRLVSSHSWFFRTPWPYLGYINLSAQSPKIEYRAGIVGLLVLVPFFIVFSPFVFLLLLINHFAQRAGIYRFIVDNATAS